MTEEEIKEFLFEFMEWLEKEKGVFLASSGYAGELFESGCTDENIEEYARLKTAA